MSELKRSEASERPLDVDGPEKSSFVDHIGHCGTLGHGSSCMKQIHDRAFRMWR